LAFATNIKRAAVDIDSILNYLSKEQIQNEELCGSEECLLDAGRLVEAASLTPISPCEGFREFSMGNFIRHQALHDRHDRVEFLCDVLTLHHERQRKNLIAPIEIDDPKTFKIAKNFFKKCVDSGMNMV
jgi:hypothetical protein